MTIPRPRILAVDDIAPNLRLLRAVLEPEGYEVITAETGVDALALAPTADLILLDIHLPDLSGFEICERLRDDPGTRAIPIVMITATASQERLRGIQSGADDFLTKPFDKDELLARARTLLRMKQYHDQLQSERSDLASTVTEQSEQIKHLHSIREYLPDQILAALERDPDLLEPHRRDVAVLFADLRGFTSFSGDAEPEEVGDVLGQWHQLIGREVAGSQATVGYFAGDGVMLFWNDPLPCPEPAAAAVDVAHRIVAGVADLEDGWRRIGYELGVGIGIAEGYATVGMIGFESRRDYTAIGPVVNLASRLSDEARAERTVLLNQRAMASLGGRVPCIEVEGGFELKGFGSRVPAWYLTDPRGSTGR